jgi:hypothetical protein
MTDTPREPTDESDNGSITDDVTGLATSSSAYKVLGELSDASGTGVLGRNTAGSGTPIGVRGVVPNTGGGYGIFTPDDAKVGGTAEVDALTDAGSGSVGFGSAVDLAGNDLVDGGTVVWDQSNGHIPYDLLSSHWVGINGTDVPLGGDLDLYHHDLLGLAPDDHHARPTAGNGLVDNSGTFDVTADGVGLNELATPFTELGDLLGSPAQTSVPIAAATTSPLAFEVYDGTYSIEALALAAGGSDVPNETRGVPAPTIVGGHPNNNTGGAAPRGATIAGGGGQYSGEDQEVTGNNATICGGIGNTVSGSGATVGGGANNTASGSDSFAAGSEAAAEDLGSFVWAGTWGYHSIPNTSNDGLSSSKAVNSEPVTGNNTFSVGARGGVRFITGSSEVTYIEGGTTGWAVSSSRTVKTDVEPVDPEGILDGVRDMEVATWEYEGEAGGGTGRRQVGPMAEEFHEVVDVGGSDEHINAVDADGVAFAAIQGLAEKVDEKEDRIDELEAENESLRDRLGSVEDRLSELESERPAPADD